MGPVLRVGVGVSASLVLHAGLFVWARSLAATEAPEQRRPEPVQLAFVVSEPPPPAPPEVEAPEPTPEPAQRPRSRRRPRPSRAPAPEPAEPRRPPREPEAEEPAQLSDEEKLEAARQLVLRPDRAPEAPAAGARASGSIVGASEGTRPTPPGLRGLGGGGGRRSGGGARGELPEKMRRTEDGGYALDDGPFTAYIAPDGSFRFEDHPMNVNGIGLQFDVTDAIMSGNGEDPYIARKRAFLEATEGLRAALKAKELGANLGRAASKIQGRLERIWASARTAEERRRMLFEIWDGALESGDEQRVAVGAQIRSTVLRFVRTELPRGSREGYTPSELRRLNAKRASNAPFAPYLEAADAVAQP